MKKLYSLLIVIILLSCSSDSDNRNPYLLETNFSFDINLNLPLYGSLSNPGSAIYIGNEGVGIRGVFVYNNGSSFFAWEASCPNHTPSPCSTMSIINGNMCKCSCEDYEYSLVNGQLFTNEDIEGKTHGLLLYQTSSNGNTITVFN